MRFFRTIRWSTVVISTVLLACSVSNALGMENGSGIPEFHIELDWYEGIFGGQIGDRGMAIADIDMDGVTEIVVAASALWLEPNRYWYILEFDGTNYLQEWKSLQYAGEIDRLVVGQYDGDAALEILIAVDGSLFVFDGQTRLLEAEYATAAGTILGLATGNLDGDPAIEVALCDESNSWVHDLESGEQQLSIPGIGCSDMAVGETDGTPGLEIVVVNVDSGYVLDADTGAVEWEHPAGFGTRVAVDDLDGDDLDEIAVAVEWDGITVWHGDSRTLAWELEISHVTALNAADVEGDGSIELVYGEGQFGRVFVLNGSSGQEKWSVPNLGGGVTRIAVGDANADGDKEVIFGAGYSSPIKNIFVVVDSVSQEIEWRSPDLLGPFLGLAHGDIDTDGDSELIYTTYHDELILGDGVFFVRDAESKILEYEGQSGEYFRHAKRFDVELADVDDDPALEIFSAVVDQSGDGIIRCIDGVTKAVQWEQQLDSNAIAGLEVGDPDGDGEAEVVASIEVQSTGAEGVFVFMFDANTGDQEFQSLNLEDFFGFWATLDLLRIADVDDDGTGEILVAESGKGLLAIDPVTEGFDLIFDELDITALEAADLDGNGVPEIIVGDEDGNISSVAPESEDVTHLLGPYPGEIHGLAVLQLVGSEALDYVFAASDRIHIVDGETATTIWVSEDLGENVGIRDSLLVGDVDDDGMTEIWVSVGTFGHMLLKIKPEMILRTGFE